MAFLLFLAGLEVEFHKLRGRVLRLTGVGFLLSFVIAVAVGLALKAGGVGPKPLFAAIILSATSLGIIIPLLKDAGESRSNFGQLVIAAGSIADFGADHPAHAVLLPRGDRDHHEAPAARLAPAAGGPYRPGGARRGTRRGGFARPWCACNTTAQIRVRGAFVLHGGFAALAQGLGLEVILGTFIAGAILKLTDRDETMMHPELQHKLEAVGYGVFIPVFFVASGLRFDLNALFSSTDTVIRVPIFLAALLVVRGLPALLYRKDLGARRRSWPASCRRRRCRSSSPPPMIGLDIGAITEANAAAFIAAGLLSVLIFPITALTVLRGAEKTAVMEPPAAAGAVRP